MNSSKSTRRTILIGGVIAAALLTGVVRWQTARADEGANKLPPPSRTESIAPGATSETAVLAGGCFWGVQGVFQHVRGVTQVLSGYAGGTAETAEYSTVSSGRTGHAESVKITFDPRVISYSEILRIFFSVALDPTEVNRQGPDTGPQYRSMVFATSESQADVARAYIAQLDQAHAFSRPIATKVEPLQAFYVAEGYHQDYLILHPTSLYIVYNDMPKVANLQRLFPEVYVVQPVRAVPGTSAS